MSDSTVELSVYQIMDKEDEKQIASADKALQAALVYEVKGKKALSITGIKWLVLKMSQKGQPLKILEHNVHLEKHDPEDKEQWVWYSEIKMQNMETKLETLGVSNSDYLEYGKRDQFGRTKAMSKATRNSERQHIPEAEIQVMLNNAQKGDIQDLSAQYSGSGNNNSITATPPEQPTAEQISELTDELRWTGTIPTSKTMIAGLILNIKKRTLAVVEKDSFWAKYMEKTDSPKVADVMVMCTCVKPHPTSQQADDGKYKGYHVCLECHSPLTHEKIKQMADRVINHI